MALLVKFFARSTRSCKIQQLLPITAANLSTWGRSSGLFPKQGFSGLASNPASQSNGSTPSMPVRPGVPFWVAKKKRKEERKKNWSVRLQNKPENSGRNQYERMYKKQKFMQAQAAKRKEGEKRARARKIRERLKRWKLAARLLKGDA